MNKRLVSILTSLTILSMSLVGCATNSGIEDQIIPQVDNIVAQANESKNSNSDIFNSFDKNKDKKISKEEFKFFVTLLIKNQTELEKAMSLFNNADKSKDGNLSFDEFNKFNLTTPEKNGIKDNKTVAVVIDKLFEMGKDSKDKMSEKAFTKMLIENKDLSTEQIAEIFKFLDKNKDAYLTKSEFSVLFEKQNKNGFFDKTAIALYAVGLFLLLPVALLIEKLGLK